MIRLWSDTWNGYAKRGYRNDEPVSSVAAFHNSMTRNSLMCSMSELGQKRKSSVGLGMSALGGEADEIGGKADIGARKSGVGGGAVVPATWPELLLLANSRPVASTSLS